MAKRTKKQCRILSLKRPKEAEYNQRHLGSVNVGTESELPDPHVYPLYGGECWRQAYDEMVSLKLLIDATTLWDWASTYTGYLPKPQKDAIFAAYEAAKLSYGVAWQVMEDCLQGQIA